MFSIRSQPSGSPRVRSSPIPANGLGPKDIQSTRRRKDTDADGSSTFAERQESCNATGDPARE